MSDSGKGILAIAKREWKRIFSSKVCIFGMLVAPILSMVILVSMMEPGLPTKIPIAVVDLDNSGTSRGLVRQLDAFSKTDIKYKTLNFSEARDMMERWEVYAILTIPKDFERDASLGNNPKLVFYTNNAFLVTGSLVFQDLKTISVLASAAVNLKVGTAKGIAPTQLMPIVQPMTIESHPLTNPWLNYSIYLNSVISPAVLHLIILLFTVSAIGCEVKAGTGRHLMDMGRGSITKVLLGKLLPYTIIFMLYALLIMSVLYHYNNFPLKGSFWVVYLNYVCMILAAQSLGVIFISLFKNYRFALSIASLFGMVSFSIAGFSFPVAAMDPMLQALSNLFPLRHFFLIYVDQSLNGIPFGYSAGRFAILLSFVALSLLFWRGSKTFLSRNIYED